MARRKKNPAKMKRGYFSLPSNLRKMKPERRRRVRNENYADRVKALRKLNKGFEAKDGYNLRDIKSGKLSSARKAKINRYIRGQAAELAALRTNRAYVARFRNKDRLEAAITASQQEEQFKGQKFAVFVTDFPEDFKVKVRVRVSGISFDTTELGRPIKTVRFRQFDPEGWKLMLADDPAYLVQAILDEHYGAEYKKFRYLTGKYKSDELIERDELAGVLAKVVFDYMKAFKHHVDEAVEFVAGWLTGITGYT